MKRTVLLVLAVLPLLCLCGWAAGEDTYTYGDFTYALLEDGSAELIRYNGPAGEVIIPNTLDGHPITSVRSNPFATFNSYRVNGVKKCTVTVSNEHPGLATIDGVLFEKTSRKLVYCPPDRVGEYTIPQGVAVIGNLAFSFCTKLTVVIMPDSISSIGFDAFSDCTSLVTARIPGSTNHISADVFYNCKALTSITLGEGVISFSGSFYGCDSLAEVCLPDSLCELKGQVFRDCDGLQEILIPKNVEAIDTYAFAYCDNLSRITVAEDNSHYSSSDGVLFSASGATLLCYPAGKPDLIYRIPESVKKVEDAAFAGCKHLTRVEYSSVSWGAYVFSSCSGLTHFDFREGLREIPQGMLSGCSGLTSIVIPDGVKYISWYAFAGCNGLTSVVIPTSVTAIGQNAFARCSSLAEITIPDSVKGIDMRVFSGCTSLTTVTIPDSVTSIGEGAFSGCTSLAMVTLPTSVTNIGNGAFSGCTSLAMVMLPTSVTNIGNGAFAECTSLTTVTIPNSIISINNNVFSKCSSLITVNIPDSITSIGDRAFFGCTNLSTLTVPQSVSNIGIEAFSECTGLTLTVFRNSYAEHYCIDNSLPYKYPVMTCQVMDNGSIRILHYDTDETSLTIPSKFDNRWITEIASDAFADCAHVTTIAIPDTVTTIAADAFTGCSPDLVITCGFGSYTARWCEENGVAYTFRQEDYGDDTSWLD